MKTKRAIRENNFEVRSLFILTVCLLPVILFSQARWTGSGNDASWMNAANWEGGQIPDSSQIVFLDNNFTDSSYTVILPSGNLSVTVAAIDISPSADNKITLILPLDNTANPGLDISGDSTSLLLRSGAIFINQSGATSGNSILLGGNLKIESGARYIHRTRRAHAGLVGQLKHDENTEEGVFEFDVPSASSTISVSDRIYGTLELSSLAAGGNVTYTAAGTRKIELLGDLIIHPGVQLKMNCSDTLHIRKNYIQHGGNLDLSTTARTLVMNVSKNFIQSEGSIITESGSVVSEILLSGEEEQQVEMKGILNNQVSLNVNNEAGVRLAAPLFLSFKLQLRQGIIRSDAVNILALEAEAIMDVDSTQYASYVDGPLRKYGLNQENYFLFPVGKRGEMRWLLLSDFSGDVQIEYMAENPRLISSNLSGINHISSTGYWKAESINGNFNQSKATLSFNNGNSSGVTDMEYLTVSSFRNGIWTNSGNSATTGSPGSAGSVTSNIIEASETSLLFTLASTNHAENPLPVKPHGFKLTKQSGKFTFSWQVSEWISKGHFVISSSGDNRTFEKWIEISAHDKLYYETHSNALPVNHSFFRLSYHDEAGKSYVAGILHHKAVKKLFPVIDQVYYERGSQKLILQVTMPEEKKLELIIINLTGRIVNRTEHELREGKNKIELLITGLPFSLYHIFGLSSGFRTNPRGFQKL